MEFGGWIPPQKHASYGGYKMALSNLNWVDF